MKKLFFLRLLYLSIAVIGILSIASCNKKTDVNGDESTAKPDYYLSFKANGVQKMYKSAAEAYIADKDTDNIYTSLLVSFKDSVNDDQDNLAIIIYSNNPISTGTYQDPSKAADNEGTQLPQVTLFYTDEAQNNFLTLGLFADEQGMIDLTGAGNIVADAKVSITEITSVYIKGTFSGTAYNSADLSGNSKQLITDGAFVLERLQ